MSGDSAEDGRPAILIVDDEQLLREVISEHLKADYRVETAASTAEADIHMGSMHFDLVLVDHLMPHEVGLDFLMRVKEHFPETRRILITGYLNPELISRAQTLADLSGYLIKPISATQLKAAVSGALNH